MENNMLNSQLIIKKIIIFYHKTNQILKVKASKNWFKTNLLS
jgi:hypothetical protein